MITLNNLHEYTTINASDQAILKRRLLSVDHSLNGNQEILSLMIGWILTYAKPAKLEE